MGSKRKNMTAFSIADCEALGIKIPPVTRWAPGTAREHGTEPPKKPAKNKGKRRKVQKTQRNRKI
jgi:hypothetical protein